MSKFKIPKTFECAGNTFTVSLKPDLQKVGAHGMTMFDTGEIWLDSNLTPEDLKGITFYHEWFHAALKTIGRDDLDRDESFVDLMGNLLWQFEKTKRY